MKNINIILLKKAIEWYETDSITEKEFVKIMTQLIKNL